VRSAPSGPPPQRQRLQLPAGQPASGSQVPSAVKAGASVDGRALAAKAHPQDTEPSAQMPLVPQRRPSDAALAVESQRDLALRRRVHMPEDGAVYGMPGSVPGVGLAGMLDHPPASPHVAGLAGHGYMEGWQPLPNQVDMLPAHGHAAGHGMPITAASYAARSQDWRWVNGQASLHPQAHSLHPPGVQAAVNATVVGTPLEVDVWLGEEGSWAPGASPPDVPVRELQLPRILGGDTQPPGPCDGKCPCAQNSVSLKADMERSWMTADRTARIQAAMSTFQSHAGVVRRGRVSGQRRFEPAAPGWHERARRQAGLHPQAATGKAEAVIVESPPRTM